LNAGAHSLDLKGNEVPNLKMGSLDDVAKMSLNVMELSIQSKRSELDRVKTDIVKGDTSQRQEVPSGESGTSFASPHVAGVVALMLEANPKLSQSDIQTIIQQTSKGITGLTSSDTGNRVNYPVAGVKQAAAMTATPES
jgi:subtilisin family serine protease